MISVANAQDMAQDMANAAPALFGGGLLGFLPLIAVFVVFYFLVLRPQSKRAAEHAHMLTTLRRGDKILTTGGLYGEIHRVNDDRTLQVALAEGVVVMLEQQSVVKVLTRATDVDNVTMKPKAKAGKQPEKTQKNSNQNSNQKQSGQKPAQK